MLFQLVLNVFYVVMNLAVIYALFEVSLFPMCLLIGDYVKGSKINEALSWLYFMMFVSSVVLYCVVVEGYEIAVL